MSTYQIENWRPIAGFENYEVSDRGSVRRVSGYHIRDGAHPRPLKPWLCSQTGYWKVCLRADSSTHRRFVHRLVAIAFLGHPPSDKHQVAHGDGTRTNNCIANLRWALPKENANDILIHGRRNSGSRNGTAILTEDIVAEIRRVPFDGYGFYARLARRFGIAQATARDIYLGDRWRHVSSAPPIIKQAPRPLSDEQIIAIRKVPYAGRGTWARLGREYGVDRNTIRDVALGRKWRNVGVDAQ